jgi:hypothetical protein
MRRVSHQKPFLVFQTLWITSMGFLGVIQYMCWWKTPEEPLFLRVWHISAGSWNDPKWHPLNTDAVPTPPPHPPTPTPWYITDCLQILKNTMISASWTLATEIWNSVHGPAVLKDKGIRHVRSKQLEYDTHGPICLFCTPFCPSLPD